MGILRIHLKIYLPECTTMGHTDYQKRSYYECPCQTISFDWQACDISTPTARHAESETYQDYLQILSVVDVII